MMQTPILILCMTTLLPACFLSSWPSQDECTAAPTCSEGYSEVGSCSRSDCTLETQCGQSIYCERDCEDFVCSDFEAEVPWCDVDSSDCSFQMSSCGGVYCQSALCNGLPMCDEGEEEVPSCAGEGEGCRSVSECGTTIYCATTCVEPSVCTPEQTAHYGACPPDESCVERQHCGETVYCVEEPTCEPVEPCLGTLSPVLSIGESCGAAPPLPGPGNSCYTEILCGIPHSCHLACATNDQLIEYSETNCAEHCYTSALPTDLWCMGDLVWCDTELTCGEGEIEMSVGELCPDDWRCRILEECTTLIQCGQALEDGE